MKRIALVLLILSCPPLAHSEVQNLAEARPAWFIPAQSTTGRQVPHLCAAVFFGDYPGLAITPSACAVPGDKLELSADGGYKAEASVITTSRDLELSVLKVDSELPPYVLAANTILSAGDTLETKRAPDAGGEVVHFEVDPKTAEWNGYVVVSRVDLRGVAVGTPLLNKSGAVAALAAWTILDKSGSPAGSYGIGALGIRLALDDVKQFGLIRPFSHLGISAQNLTPQLAAALMVTDHQEGAVLSKVPPSSPGARLGLKPADIVVSLNGIPVTGATSLVQLLKCRHPGEDMAFDLLRDGHKLQLNLKMPEIDAAQQPNEK